MLILCQICFAIAMQKVGGTFLIKFFDTFTRISLEMLYLLSTVYEEVYVIKPHTSRYANSEKYIVCKKYRANPNLAELIHKFYEILKELRTSPASAMSSILNIEIGLAINVGTPLEKVFEFLDPNKNGRSLVDFIQF